MILGQNPNRMAPMAIIRVADVKGKEKSKGKNKDASGAGKGKKKIRRALRARARIRVWAKMAENKDKNEEGDGHKIKDALTKTYYIWGKSVYLARDCWRVGKG